MSADATSRQQGAGREAGLATVMLVMVLVVSAIVTGVVVESSLRSGHSSQQTRARTSNQAIAEQAIARLQLVFEARRTGMGDEFTLQEDDLARVARDIGGRTVPNSATAYPDTQTSGAAAVTVVGTTGPDGLAPHWQVLDVIGSTPTDPNAILYVRAWQQPPGQRRVASPARVVRAELRPGSFADFQVLSDSPIAFENNSTINGSIHSNGFESEGLAPRMDQDQDLRVWGSGSLSCASGGGPRPVVSTARGSIDPAIRSAGCETRPYGGRFIDLAAARAATVRIRNRCNPSDRVYCWVAPGAPVNGTYRVVFSTTSATVYGASGGAGTSYALPSGAASTFLFNRDVNVSGTTQGRVTVATYNGDQANVPATDIILVGNTGSLPSSATAANTLGLIAESDVIVSTAGCLTNVRAAVIASTGSFGLDRADLTPTIPGGSPMKCTSPLTVTGSTVSHSPTVLRWRWGGTDWTGYADRRYQWDPWLRHYPPPYFPLTDTWEIVRIAQANADCYGGGPGAGSRTCL